MAVNKERAGIFTTSLRRFIGTVSGEFYGNYDVPFTNWVRENVANVLKWSDIGVLALDEYPNKWHSVSWNFVGDAGMANEVEINRKKVEGWLKAAHQVCGGDNFDEVESKLQRIEASLPSLDTHIEAAKFINNRAEEVTNELVAALEPLASF